MKILMVSSFLPYPLFSGGHIRLYNLIKELSKKHEITLVCELRDYQTKEDIAKIEKFCKKVLTVDRKKQWSVSNITKAVFSLYPFLIVGHTSLIMRKKIEEVLFNDKIDVIHVETFYVMQNVPKTNIPIILVEHNIEYLAYQRFVDKTLFFIRPFLSLDVKKIKYWEQEFWQKATKLVTVSEEEKRIMDKVKNAALVPNGVDVSKFKVQSSTLRRSLPRAESRGSGQEFKVNDEEKRILFIGDFRWIKNRDAIEWIIKDIWPEINSKLKIPHFAKAPYRLVQGKAPRGKQNSKLSLRLWIVGKQIPASIKNISDDQAIIFDENAPSETWKIFQKADILLAPIRVGGGTSFKILEAMASGVPVVTTSLGIEGLVLSEAEGIEGINNREVLVADDAQGLSDAVVDILENKEKYTEIANSARRLIEEKYDWKIIVKKLEDVYTSVL